MGTSPRRYGRRSAGLLMYRRRAGVLEVLLVHPGGPLWARRNLGAWSIPKGEMNDPSEDPLDAARREFAEETGFAPGTQWTALGEVRQRNGKLVMAWAFEGDADPAALVSNTFEMEWPPRSGRRQAFAEVDRAGWFTLEAARLHLNDAQVVFLERLQALVG
ncbi:NUDIX domain-containing protein [Variovorax sp. dw_308]|uniref:NUDIX domain-containing protein n=1 Tax=Variovorax sp. dw_308 TaxID=2721546 RepID=UPI001C43A513|nr:NUDIX domain-containing protein [Variovorax sp. dw_308]